MGWKYKYTQYLNGAYHGASESYYLDLTPQPLKVLLESLVPLLQKRGAMLAQDWRTHSHDIVVVTDDAGVPQPREGLNAYRAYASGSPRPALPEDTAIKYRVFGGGLWVNKYKFLNFSGGPKAALSSDDAFSNDAVWISTTNAFLVKLMEFSPGWFIRERSDPANVVGYTMGATGVVTVELDGPLIGADVSGGPFRVRIAGVNGRSELNNEWTAYNYQFPGAGAVAASFQLKTRVGVWAYQSPGTATTYSPQWVPYGVEPATSPAEPVVDVWGGGKLQHGPPFGISAGRPAGAIRG